MVGVLLFAQAIAYACYRLTNKNTESAGSIADLLKSRKMLVFLKNRVHCTFESSFLLIAISVLLQF